MGSSEEKYTGGAIWLHRKITEWEWYTDANTMRVFLHCLLRANWKDGRFCGEPVPRGSFITSYRSLARDLNLTERSVRTALEHLNSTHEVTQHSTNRYTVITVNNYDDYQSGDTQNDKRTTNKRQTDDNRLTTNEESNKGIKKERNRKEPKPPNRGWELVHPYDAEWWREHHPADGWVTEIVDGVEWIHRVKQ